jgi:hypothetical protein
MASEVTQERLRTQSEQATPDARQRAHELIDCLPDAQISALVGFLKTIVDPEFEDEEISEEEEQAAARAKEWFKTNQGIPFEEVVAELGFTMEQVRNYKEPT